MMNRTEELKKNLKILRENKGELGEIARAFIFKAQEGELKGRQEMAQEILDRLMDETFTIQEIVDLAKTPVDKTKKLIFIEQIIQQEIKEVRE